MYIYIYRCVKNIICDRNAAGVPQQTMRGSSSDSRGCWNPFSTGSCIVISCSQLTRTLIVVHSFSSYTYTYTFIHIYKYVYIYIYLQRMPV